MGGRPGEPAAQELLQSFHVPGLALVRPQRGDLAREGLRDVDVVAGDGGALQPDLADGPGLESLVGEQVREGEGVAGVGIDGVQRRRAHGAVIGMADAQPGVVPLR